MSAPKPKRAVYTALLGRYEALVEQPTAARSEADYFCFTDDPQLTSSTWTIVLIESPMLGDPVRGCRILKIRGHESLKAYDETLWIDNSVLLKVAPETLMASWLADSDITMPWHSYRSNLAAEFDAVASTGRDDPTRVFEQLNVYVKYAPELLESEVLWTAILARRPTPHVELAMRFWLDHVLRYSRRDQLSIGYALSAAQLIPAVQQIDSRDSEWHTWPVTSGRPPEREFEFATARGPAENAPAVAELARLHRDIDELTTQYSDAVAVREAYLADILASRTWVVRTRVRNLMDSTTRFLRRNG